MKTLNEYELIREFIWDAFNHLPRGERSADEAILAVLSGALNRVYEGIHG